MLEENIVLVAYAVAPIICGVLLYLFFVRYKQHKQITGRLRRLLAANCLVLLMLLGVLLLAGEIYYRFLHDTTDSYGAARTTQEWIKRHYQFNRGGVRDSLPVYRARRAPGKRRITIIGDSFTAGHGVADVEDRFANLIRHQRPGWEVHVFAKNGLDTRGHLDYIDTALRNHYELDIVVLAYCLNDIADIIKPWNDHKIAMVSQHNLSWLVRHSYVLDTWYHRISYGRDPWFRNYFEFVRDAYDSNLWVLQQRRLRTLHQKVTAGGGRLTVMTFPFIHNIGPNYDWRDTHQKLDVVWRDLDTPHLDLLPVYEPYSSEELVVNAYDAHPNEYAHRLAADALLSFLDQLTEESR